MNYNFKKFETFDVHMQNLKKIKDRSVLKPDGDGITMTMTMAMTMAMTMPTSIHLLEINTVILS